MKKGLLLIFVVMISSHFVAQPWVIKKDFNFSFKDNYTEYQLSQERIGDKIYYSGYLLTGDKGKLFNFQTSVSSNKKNGWFNFIDTLGKRSFSILFVDGNATQLSYKTVDSLVFTFTIDNDLLNGVHSVYYDNGNIKEYGYYKNNARVGEWRFYYSNGNVESEGSYEDEYSKIIYDPASRNMVTLNRYLDTVRVELFTQKIYDSLRQAVHEEWDIMFPLHLHKRIGVWKFYDDNGQLFRSEIYNEGKLIKVASIAGNAGQRQPGIDVDSIEKKWLLLVDSLQLNKCLEEAKWRLYCIYCSDTCILKPKYHNGVPVTFGTLEMKLRSVAFEENKVVFVLKFYINNVPCENGTLEQPLIIVHGVAIDKKSAKAKYFDIADGVRIYAEGGSSNSRYKNPLQEEVVAYIKQNIFKINPWFREEARKRRVVK